MIGRSVGRYRIVEKLGQGGMGSVWRADDTLLGRAVALKLLADDLAASPDARRRFLREGRAACLLDHPCVTTVYEAGEFEGAPFIALALIEGETVTHRIARGALDTADAVRIAIASAEALGHAHGRGVIHRDVSGGNIMLARDGRVFLVDFGLAQVRDRSRLTDTNATIGTCAYLAPEIIEGREADQRSDLYGLGVVLYELLAGAHPFRADRIEPLIYAIVHHAPDPPSSRNHTVPEWLDRLVLKALAKNPNDRHQNADEFLSELRAGASEMAGVAAAPPTSSDRLRTVVGSQRTTLAIMPFTSVDADLATAGEEQHLIARGIAEAVSAALARSTSLEVIPPAGAEHARGAGLSMSGALRRAGTRLRLSYSVMDVARGRTVHADTIEGEVGRLFELEDELIASVSAALGLDTPTARAASARSEDPAAHERYLQALGYLQRHDNEASIDGAITLLERLAATPSAPVFAALGRAYVQKRRITSEERWGSRAAAACQRALELDPDAPEVLVTLGEVHNAAGRYADAIADFDRALAARPDDADALLGAALAHMNLDRFAEAEDSARRVIALRPHAWNGYSRLGVIYYRQAQYARAAEPWRMVTRLSPDNPSGHMNLAAAYFGMDRFADAAAEYRRSIEIRPTAVAWSNLGTVEYYLGHFREAAEACERAANLQPSDPRLWGNLASARTQVPELRSLRAEAEERAIALMVRSLETNPNRAEDWAWLASWQADLGRATEASAAIARAIELEPQDVNAIAQIGIAYGTLGDREQASKWVLEAVRRGLGLQRLLREPELKWLSTDPEFCRMIAERSSQSAWVDPSDHEPGGRS